MLQGYGKILLAGSLFFMLVLGVGTLYATQVQGQTTVKAENPDSAINHGADGKFHHKHRFMMVGFEKMAEMLGVTEEQLKTELKAGKSLAEIAQSQGISKEELVNKIKAELTPKLERWVEWKHGHMQAK